MSEVLEAKFKLRLFRQPNELLTLQLTRFLAIACSKYPVLMKKCSTLIDAYLNVLNGTDESSSTPPLPPLFPAPAVRPLIEEVGDCGAAHATAASASTSHPVRIPAPGPRRSLSFDVHMGRPVDRPQARLKVQVQSELASLDDYFVAYRSRDNSLIISHNDTQHYFPKEIAIALPHALASQELEISTSFDSGSRTMAIYL